MFWCNKKSNFLSNFLIKNYFKFFFLWIFISVSFFASEKIDQQDDSCELINPTYINKLLDVWNHGNDRPTICIIMRHCAEYADPLFSNKLSFALWEKGDDEDKKFALGIIRSRAKKKPVDADVNNAISFLLKNGNQEDKDYFQPLVQSLERDLRSLDLNF